MSIRYPLTLRRLLMLDAGTCLLMGLVLVAATGPVAAATALPRGLLLGAGLLLLPIAAFMAWVSRSPSVAGVRLVVAGNLLWVFASVLLPAWPGIEPSVLGLAGVFAQAAGVAALALLEHWALGRPALLASAR